MEIVGGIAAVLGVVVAVIAYLWPRQRAASKQNLESESLQGSEDVLERVFASKVIRVGFFRYPPLIDVDASEDFTSPDGLYGEMLKLIASQEGLSLECVVLNTGDAIEAIEQQKVDLVLCIFRTDERSKKVDFSALLHTVKVGGLKLASESSIKAVGDLQQTDIRVAVIQGEIGHEWARVAMRIPKKRLRIIDTSENTDVGTLVELRHADIALADLVTLNRFLSARGNRAPLMKLVFRRDPVTVCANGVAVRRGQEAWAEWLDTKFRDVRDLPPINELEDEILSEYKNIIQRN